MFLTKKSLKKIRLLTVAYLILGVICFAFYAVFTSLFIECNFLLILGIISWAFGAVFCATGRYAEGKAKLLNMGNKLVLRELRPAEFVRLYEQARDCTNNVVSKPDFDVLQMVSMAYDAMGDTERELETLDQMFLIADDKKKTRVKLLKASVLYSVGRLSEADKLYNEALNEKMDLLAQTTLDAVIKGDRAMALGDFATAEAYHKQMLARTTIKNIPLSVLVIHFSLATIYYKTERFDEAKIHLDYCVKNGGETGMKSAAADMLNNL